MFFKKITSWMDSEAANMRHILFMCCDLNMTETLMSSVTGGSVVFGALGISLSIGHLCYACKRSHGSW